MAASEVRIPVEEARGLASKILVDAGAPDAHAELQTELLIDGELRGHASHGLLRLPRLVRRIHMGVIDPRASGELEWAHPARLEVDGRDGLGAVVSHTALGAITERARETGIAAALVRRSNHIGMLAHWGELVAAKGQVLVASTTSEALVHPWGGSKALVGTNPLAIAVPTEGEPLLLDMATSSTSMGKIHACAAAGRPLGDGWAVDDEGHPTRDASAALEGAISPFGGAKGYALGLALEVLIASLTGTALGEAVKGTLDDDQVSSKGDVFVVAEPAPAMKASIAAYLEEVRNSPPSEPGGRITVPGDGGYERRARALAEGLTLPAALWAELESIAAGGGAN